MVMEPQHSMFSSSGETDNGTTSCSFPRHLDPPEVFLVAHYLTFRRLVGRRKDIPKLRERQRADRRWGKNKLSRRCGKCFELLGDLVHLVENHASSVVIDCVARPPISLIPSRCAVDRTSFR